MKNLYSVLLSATFASILSSTMMFSSEEVTTPPAQSIETAISIDQTPATLITQQLPTILLSSAAGELGVYGTIAGAAGSHALKKAKRNLTTTNNITSQTLIQLNKGIKGNRIIMAASLATCIAGTTMATLALKPILDPILDPIVKAALNQKN